MKFPAYRKYPNNKSYFKVLNNESFEEVTIVARSYSIRMFHAQVHPDRMMISDMIHLHGGHWVEISEQEYVNFVSHCEQEYKKTV